MNRRVTSILLLCVMSLHALFGWGQGATAICLGGGHGHGHDDHDHPCEQATACEHTCDHDAGFATPVAVDNHEDECGCTDITLTFVGQLATARSATDKVAIAGAAPLAVCDIVVEASTDIRRRGPPGRWADDPATRHRLAVLRATRLNV